MPTPKQFSISKCLLRRALYRPIFAKDCPRCSVVCLR